MKKQIKKLETERNELEERLTKVKTAIQALQDVCTHRLEDGKSAYEYSGHNSHKNYHTCSICGDMDWY